MHINIKKFIDKTNHLCASCSNGHVFKTSTGISYTNCSWMDTSVSPFRQEIIECSKYKDATAMDMHEMKEAAWILEKRKKDFGFSPPKKKEFDYE